MKSSPVAYAIKTKEDHTNKPLNYYSSWYRIKEAVAWFLRLRQILCKKSHHKEELAADELRDAEEAIIRYAQKVFLNKVFLKNKQIHKLNPRRSATGLLIVGGRLTNSKQKVYAKHQLILSYEHPVSKLIVEEFHQRTGHPGVERTLADTRRRYWILKGRNLVKK